MVILHVHKGGIRVGLTVIVPPLEVCRMPVIDGLAFQKSAEEFQISLVPALPLTPSMDKNSPFCLTAFFQKQGYLLQILCPCFFTHRKILYVFMVQKLYGILYLLEHFFFPLPNRLFPHKSILVGTGFQLCPVNEYRFL